MNRDKYNSGIVCVCVPVAFEYVHTQHYMSMISLVKETDAPVCMSMSTASMGAAHTRNLLMNAVGEMDKQGVSPEWLMWIDSDMLVPSNTINRLLAHQREIVGATYVRRAPPYEVLGKSLSGSLEDVTGLVEVKALPAGCLLVHRSVFDRLRKPYWKIGVNEAANHIVGEDMLFCGEARDAGFKIWLDVELTREVGHIGQQVFYPPKEEPKHSSLVRPPIPSIVGIPANGHG